MQGKHKQIATCGLLVAVALVLSWIERMFPIQALIPIPGIKLGLANVVILFALQSLSMGQALAILIVRVTLSSLFMGSVTAFLFSLFGGVLSMIVMKLLQFSRHVSIIGISIGGAAAHHIGQILAAILVLGTIQVAGYLPFLLVLSIPMGLVTGIVCKIVLEHLKKLQIV